MIARLRKQAGDFVSAREGAPRTDFGLEAGSRRHLPLLKIPFGNRVLTMVSVWLEA